MLAVVGAPRDPAGDTPIVNCEKGNVSAHATSRCRPHDTAGGPCGVSCPDRSAAGVPWIVIDHSLAIDSLRRCALFEHVDEVRLDTIARLMRRRRFRRHEVIFHQGDIGDSLQVVVSGAVKIVLPSAEGDEAIIASLGPGDFFGELALLDSSPRSTTATAIEATETLTLPQDEFLRLIDEDPHLVRALLHTLAQELRRLTGHVEELHILDLSGRVSMRLVRLARERDPDAIGRAELDWPYTQSDLAAMIGGTRQSVNRLLSGLVDDELITIDRDTLVINDLAALERHGSR